MNFNVSLGHGLTAKVSVYQVRTTPVKSQPVVLYQATVPSPHSVTSDSKVPVAQSLSYFCSWHLVLPTPSTAPP